jgi:hypothetical protein
MRDDEKKDVPADSDSEAREAAARQKAWDEADRKRRQARNREAFLKLSLVAAGLAIAYVLLSLLWAFTLPLINGITYTGGFFTTLGLFGLHTALSAASVALLYGGLHLIGAVRSGDWHAEHRAVFFLTVPVVFLYAAALQLVAMWFPDVLNVDSYWNGVVLGLLASGIAHTVHTLTFCYEKAF